MVNETRSQSDSDQKSSHKGQFILGATMSLLVTWILVSFLHNLSITGYAETGVAWIRSSLSMFRVTLIVGFGGSLLSIPFLRRRSHGQALPVRPVEPHHTDVPTKVHPLHWFQDLPGILGSLSERPREEVGLQETEPGKGFTLQCRNRFP